MNSDTSQPDTSYDVIVIGGGSAGENAADVAARGELSVALIEHDLVGGECTYWACMPSKALLRPGDALQALRRVPGIQNSEDGIDVDEALDRRNALAAHWDDSGQVEWLEGVGVDLIRGHGRLSGERLVSVVDSAGRSQVYRAGKAVVIATGSSPSFPPIDGLEEVEVWDSRDATSSKEVPRSLLVIGGGAVGVEMAQAWKWLGAEEVTILELSDNLLADEETFVGEELEASLVSMGVTVHTGATTRSIHRRDRHDPATVRVELTDGSEIEIEAEEVLVATGRGANTADLGLESIDLEPGEPISVDDHLQAHGIPGEWLYAVGDVNGRSLLTHTGKYQARIAGAHITGVDTRAWGDEVALPRVVFTSPTVAAVGLTEKQATEQGIDARTVEHDIGMTAGAATLGQGYSGTCKLVIDPSNNTLIGATFVGPQVGELLHAATIAIVGEVPLQTLWHAVPAFPTLSEVWLRLLEGYRDQYDEVFR